MGQVWEGTSPWWAGTPPPPHKGPRCLGFGEAAPPPYLGGKFPPLPPLAATLDGFGAAAPLGVETLKGAHSLPSPLYILEDFGAADT